jgi:hypothetical protein
MSFQATTPSGKPRKARRYPTLEAALLGNDGLEFQEWATGVISTDPSTKSAIARVLKALLPVTYPFLGQPEANRLVNDWVQKNVSPSGKEPSQSSARAFLAGLLFGGRIGKLTAAHAALSGTAAYIADMRNPVPAEPDILSSIVHSRPVGSEATVEFNRKTTSVAVPMPPGMTDADFEGTLDQIASTFRDEQASNARRRAAKEMCADSRPDSPLKGGGSAMIAELLRAVAEGRFRAGDGVDSDGRTVQLDGIRADDVVDLLKNSGKYRQDPATGAWQKIDATQPEESFTERPGGGDRATAGSGPTSFSTDAKAEAERTLERETMAENAEREAARAERQAREAAAIGAQSNRE